MICREIQCFHRGCAVFFAARRGAAHFKKVDGPGGRQNGNNKSKMTASNPQTRRAVSTIRGEPGEKLFLPNVPTASPWYTRRQGAWKRARPRAEQTTPQLQRRKSSCPGSAANTKFKNIVNITTGDQTHTHSHLAMFLQLGPKNVGPTRRTSGLILLEKKLFFGALPPPKQRVTK